MNRSAEVHPAQGIGAAGDRADRPAKSSWRVETRLRRKPVRGDHQRAADDDRQARGEAGLAACPSNQSGEKARWMGQLQGKAVAEAVELVGQLPGRFVAIGRVFCETFQADCVELDGDLMPETTRRFRLFLQHARQGLHERVGAKRRAAGQDLVEDRTHAINVGPFSDRLDSAGRLFGSHVGGRAFDHDRRGLGRSSGLLHQAHQAEIGDARLPLCIEQDIRGF